MTPTDQLAPDERLKDPVELSAASFSRFARFISGELGIKMPASKVTLVQSRLLRRVRDLRLESLERYAEYFFASGNGEEREHFINAITTNKTDFFREPEHFVYLREVILPARTREGSSRGARFKAWSAGCSSGEEPYTLAMVLAEYAGTQPGFDFAILATDVSTKVLRSAEAAIYQEAQILPVRPELRKKYLLRSRSNADGRARVVPELRRKVSFHQLNFMDADYAVRDQFDAVFFRNVMIYFDRPTQEAVIGKICRNLIPGGYLFAGHSESLAGLDIPVRPVKASIYRKPV
ncbi:MAG: protein-glutamate O-methyltransferase CheR [Bryobacteraceae bacterium]|jgi:chemotaxis protein methyltransferase CheR